MKLAGPLLVLTTSVEIELSLSNAHCSSTTVAASSHVKIGKKQA